MRHDLFPAAVEQGIVPDDQAVDQGGVQTAKPGVDFLGAGSLHGQEFEVPRPGGRRDVRNIADGDRVVRIGEHGDARGLRHHLAQQFKLLDLQLGGEEGAAGHVAARMAEAFDKAQPDRIVAAHEYHGNGRGQICGELMPSTAPSARR